MVRPTRDVRRGSVVFGQLGTGDLIILFVSGVLFLAIMLNWWVSNMSVNAWQFSQLYFVIVLLVILATLAVDLYPLLETEMGFRPLPVATPPLFLGMGFLLLLMTTYELGRYDPILPNV